MPVEPPEAPKIGPPAWIEWAKKTKAAILANRPISGAGTTVSDAVGGRAINATPGSGGSSSAASHPFQVLERNSGTTESPVWEYGVIFESSLYKSKRPNDKQAITGLLSEDQSTGWFTLSPGGYIWLGVTFDGTGEVTAAVIDNSDENEYDLTAEAWSGNNGYCESDGGSPPVHQTTRKLIAYTVSGESAPILTQTMTSNQVLLDGNENSRHWRYLEDWDGGYPL